MQRKANALVIRVDYNNHVVTKPSERRRLEVVVAAAEASLPSSAIISPARFVSAQFLEGVYSQPSHALTVLQTVQDAFRLLLFQCGLAAGTYWDDVVQVDGETVRPSALVLARNLVARCNRGGLSWFICQGYGEWDMFVTASLSLTSSVRRGRRPRQREAVEALQRNPTIRAAAAQLKMDAHSYRKLVRRAHAQEAWNLEAVVARYLDLAYNRDAGLQTDVWTSSGGNRGNGTGAGRT